MQTVGAQWLLVGHSAALVTLVQTASSLPVVLLALPSGVLADRYDRRKVLLAAQFAMLAVSTVLPTVLAFQGTLAPGLRGRSGYVTGDEYRAGPCAPGVGLGRTAQRRLSPGPYELISSVRGIGELRQRFVG